jgi:putative redox protein
MAARPPEVVKLATKAQVSWLGGMCFLGRTESGHVVLLDGAPEVGGRERGPRPMEVLLVALGGCTGMDVVSILQKMREPLEGLELEISGHRAGEHPRVYTDIEIRYRARGEGLDPEKVRRAVELSAQRYCSVGNMLGRAARLSYFVEVNGTSLGTVTSAAG